MTALDDAVAAPADLADATATELLALYAAGEATPRDAVEACLARIEAAEPALNAIITLLAEEALAGADAALERWRSGTARPIEGVPYGLKDIIATEGVLTTGGSGLYLDHVPTETAAHVTRLDDAGGLLLAKLGTFEFACGGAANQAFGPVRNPWDLSRTTGGSSSGSGAAVAAGMVPLAIGTDTGGSIRIPAAYCGITGLKPTYGRVPRHGVMGLSWSLDHAGPMARSVADAALMLGLIAGPDERDPYASARPVPGYVAELGTSAGRGGWRVGRLRGWYEEPMHPAVAAAYDDAVGELATLGIEVADVELPGTAVAVAGALCVLYTEMLSLHEGHLPTIEERDSMGAGLLAAAPFVAGSDYVRGLRHRRVFQQELSEAMAGFDAFVLPGACTAPPPLATMLADTGDGVVDWLGLAMRNHIPFNYSGSPALCVPGGLSGGLPVSVQLVGRPHDEATLFAIGAAYQAATAHHQARPPLLG